MTSEERAHNLRNIAIEKMNGIIGRAEAIIRILKVDSLETAETASLSVNLLVGLAEEVHDVLAQAIREKGEIKNDRP